MRPYLIKRVLGMLKLLKKYENIRLREIMMAILSKNERKKLLDAYSELGVREAGKYFVVDPNSDKSPFLETFILNQYKFCDYSGKTVIDVGANTGDSVLYFSYRGAKKIYAFEPLKDNYIILERNVALNKVCCNCYNVGLGNITKDVDVYVRGAMATALVTDSLEYENIKIDKLNNFNIDADIIKIDVEGFETEVLKGGLKTIKNAKTIIIETHSKKLQVEVAKLLLGSGFHLSKVIKNYLIKNVRVEYWHKL